VNIWIRENKLRIENKKKGDNVMTPLPPRRKDSMRSLRYNTQVISILSTSLGFDKSFSLRGANDTKPRNHSIS